MKDYLFYQNAIGCYDKGNGVAKAIVCAGLAFFARKGYMKAKYKTTIGPSVRTATSFPSVSLRPHPIGSSTNGQRQSVRVPRPRG